MREPYAVKAARTVPGRGEDDNIFSLLDEGMIRQGDRAQANYRKSEALPYGIQLRGRMVERR
jgi:hypothetical protein